MYEVHSHFLNRLLASVVLRIVNGKLSWFKVTMKSERGPLLFSEADVTLTGLLSLLVSCLDGARFGGDKLLCWTNSSQPKTVEVGKVVTRTTCTLALNEGVSPEILKTAARRSQRLATTLITCSCVLKGKGQWYTLTKSIFLSYAQIFYHTHQEEGVSRPQAPPARWACWDFMILAVKCHCRRNCLTHHTAADVGANLLAKKWHHGYGSGGGEPIGFVVTTREVTGSFVAVGKRHCGENREAGASLAYRQRK